MNKKVSFRVAFGGIVAALCLVLMFMTGLIPVLVYTLPAVAGVLLVSVVIEIDKKWALITYAAVGLLSLLITPDREAAILFIFFMGYYPIIKAIIEKIKSRILEWAIKIIIFNVAIISAYVIIINVFGIKDVMEQVPFFGKYSSLVLLALGNVVFVIYDIAVTRLISAYINWFRPKFINKIRWR